MRADSCACQSGAPYAACCGRYLDGGDLPATAEALMRSRYSAYAAGREDYLLETWYRSRRPERLSLESSAPVKWLGLKILRTEGGGPEDTRGVVEFVARYKVGGRAERLQETSRFVREGGRWFYMDGHVASP